VHGKQKQKTGKTQKHSMRGRYPSWDSARHPILFSGLRGALESITHTKVPETISTTSVHSFFFSFLALPHSLGIALSSLLLVSFYLAYLFLCIIGRGIEEWVHLEARHYRGVKKDWPSENPHAYRLLSWSGLVWFGWLGIHGRCSGI